MDASTALSTYDVDSVRSGCFSNSTPVRENDFSRYTPITANFENLKSEENYHCEESHVSAKHDESKNQVDMLTLDDNSPLTPSYEYVTSSDPASPRDIIKHVQKSTKAHKLDVSIPNERSSACFFTEETMPRNSTPSLQEDATVGFQKDSSSEYLTQGSEILGSTVTTDDSCSYSSVISLSHLHVNQNESGNDTPKESDKQSKLSPCELLKNNDSVSHSTESRHNDQGNFQSKKIFRKKGRTHEKSNEDFDVKVTNNSREGIEADEWADWENGSEGRKVDESEGHNYDSFDLKDKCDSPGSKLQEPRDDQNLEIKGIDIYTTCESNAQHIDQQQEISTKNGRSKSSSCMKQDELNDTITNADFSANVDLPNFSSSFQDDLSTDSGKNTNFTTKESAESKHYSVLRSVFSPSLHMPEERVHDNSTSEKEWKEQTKDAPESDTTWEEMDAAKMISSLMQPHDQEGIKFMEHMHLSTLPDISNDMKKAKCSTTLRSDDSRILREENEKSNNSTADSRENQQQPARWIGWGNRTAFIGESFTSSSTANRFLRAFNFGLPFSRTSNQSTSERDEKAESMISQTPTEFERLLEQQQKMQQNMDSEFQMPISWQGPPVDEKIAFDENSFEHKKGIETVSDIRENTIHLTINENSDASTKRISEKGANVAFVSMNQSSEFTPKEQISIQPLAEQLNNVDTMGERHGILNIQQTVGSNKPRTAYNSFLDRLKHPSCVGVVASVKRFVETFPPNTSRATAAKRIHPFLSQTQVLLLKADVFANAAKTAGEQQQVMEGLEKFVMQKLHGQLFYDKDDAYEDESLQKKLFCLQWIKPRHLELPELPNRDALTLGYAELKRLSRMKCPRDKLVLILNCCRVIISVLDAARRASGSSAPPAADDILPLLIYVIIQANAEQLVSNIQFISHFRHPSRLVSEEAYFFTQFCSAVEFIKGLGSYTNVDVPQKIYEENIEFYRRKLEQGEVGISPENSIKSRKKDKLASGIHHADNFDPRCGTSGNGSGPALAAAASALSTLQHLSQKTPQDEKDEGLSMNYDPNALEGAVRELIHMMHEHQEIQQKQLLQQQQLLHCLDAVAVEANERGDVAEVKVGDLAKLFNEHHNLLHTIRSSVVSIKSLIHNQQKQITHSKRMNANLIDALEFSRRHSR